MKNTSPLNLTDETLCLMVKMMQNLWLKLHTQSEASHTASVSHWSKCFLNLSWHNPIVSECQYSSISSQFECESYWFLIWCMHKPIFADVQLVRIKSCLHCVASAKVGACWALIYLSLPLTSVAAAPFVNRIVAVTALLSISWSVNGWCVWPALQVEGVWPHSSVTSVSSSLTEKSRGKLGIRTKRPFWPHCNILWLNISSYMKQHVMLEKIEI